MTIFPLLSIWRNLFNDNSCVFESKVKKWTQADTKVTFDRHQTNFFWSQMKDMILHFFCSGANYGIDFASIKSYHQFCSFVDYDDAQILLL